MILAMIRHGQTDYNLNRLVQGRMDNILNTNGKEQAQALGRHLKGLNDSFDILGTSPLLRAKETAEIVGSLLDLKVSYIDEDFTERDFGPYEGKSIDEVLPLITKNDFKVFGYEDNEILIQRIKLATDALYERFSDQKVLFVAHSHVIKALLILSNPAKYDYTNHFVGNSSVIYFDISPNDIKVIKQIDL